jgi:hypothetical protein
MLTCKNINRGRAEWVTLVTQFRLFDLNATKSTMITPLPPLLPLFYHASLHFQHIKVGTTMSLFLFIDIYQANITALLIGHCDGRLSLPSQ